MSTVPLTLIPNPLRPPSNLDLPTTGDAANQLARENLKQLDNASGTLGQQLPAFPEVARSLKTQARVHQGSTKQALRRRGVVHIFAQGKGSISVASIG